MNMFRRICVTLVAMCVLATVAQTAQAANPYALSGLYGYPSPYYGYFGFGRYTSNARVIPYFSLHPPVYYSHSVPRPYGFSPFALPPGIPPAEGVIPVVSSKEIINPYFKPKAEAKDVTDKSVKTAQMIINPFFKPSHLPDDQRYVFHRD